jgi:hypothetical protein
MVFILMINLFLNLFSASGHLIDKSRSSDRGKEIIQKRSEIMKMQNGKSDRTKKSGKNAVGAIIFIGVMLLCYGSSFGCPNSDKNVSDDTAFLGQPSTPTMQMKLPTRTAYRPVTINQKQLRQAHPVCPKGSLYYPRTKTCLPIPK